MARNPVTVRPDTIVISNISPLVEGGRYAVKRVPGESLCIEADLIKDGHDQLAAVLKWRKASSRVWQETSLRLVDNDRWSATIVLDEIGEWRFTIEAWCDLYLTWIHDFERRLTGDQEDFSVDLEEGRRIFSAASNRAALKKARTDAQMLASLAEDLPGTPPLDVPAKYGTAVVHALMARWPDRSFATEWKTPCPVWVDHPRARFSSW
ncbi:MAG: maltotransferase domain-containing protein [Verrucomicrobiales bacterium]